MATLVTGGTGFVGSNIVNVLAQHGHNVISLDIAEPDDLVLRYLEPLKDQVNWVHGDICDPQLLEQITSTYRIDKIVHAAVYTSYFHNVEKDDARRILDINITGTTNLLELARTLPVKRFLYVSSGGVYWGERSPDESLHEDVPLNPTSLYNITKHASELLTRRYGELHGFDTVSVRASGCYGPMERLTGYRISMSLIHKWTGKAVRREPIIVSPKTSETDFAYILKGGGDFTYVVDSAKGILAALDTDTHQYPVYNVSRGHRVSVNELINAMKEAYPNIVFVEPIPHESQLIGPSGYGRGPMDPSRIQDDLGFVPQYNLANGLKAYFTWRHTYNYMD